MASPKLFSGNRIRAVATAFGVLAFSSATASADPVPPPPDDSVLDPSTILGQNEVPQAPGGPPVAPPNLNPLNNGYLLPQNEVPAAPGEGAMVGVPPGQENADTSVIDYLGRLRDAYVNGDLAGAMLGQVPHDPHGGPLATTPSPATAPAPPG